MQVRTYEPTNTRVRVCVCVVRVCVLVCVCVCELIKTRKGSWKHAFRRSPRKRKKKKKGKNRKKKNTPFVGLPEIGRTDIDVAQRYLPAAARERGAPCVV